MFSFLSMVFIPEYEICYYQIKKKGQTTSSKRQNSCRLHQGLMTSVTLHQMKQKAFLLSKSQPWLLCFQIHNQSPMWPQKHVTDFEMSCRNISYSIMKISQYRESGRWTNMLFICACLSVNKLLIPMVQYKENTEKSQMIEIAHWLRNQIGILELKHDLYNPSLLIQSAVLKECKAVHF